MDLSPIAIPVLTTLETVRICVPTIVEAQLGRVRRDVCDQRLAEWSETAVRLAEIDLNVTGLEHVDPKRPYVVMSNHQSSYDIFVLMHAFPGTLRMVAKREMFGIPILGGAMTAAEFVAVDRGNHHRARAALDYAGSRIESGVNVWISPEGTRSPDGRLLPFKKGGFMLALQTGTPILPVSLVGTRDVLVSKSYRVNRGKKVGVHFHAPVDPKAFGPNRRGDLMNEVRERVAAGLPPEWRVERPHPSRDARADSKR